MPPPRPAALAWTSRPKRALEPDRWAAASGLTAAPAPAPPDGTRPASQLCRGDCRGGRKVKVVRVGDLRSSPQDWLAPLPLASGVEHPHRTEGTTDASLSVARRQSTRSRCGQPAPTGRRLTDQEATMSKRARA